MCGGQAGVPRYGVDVNETNVVLEATGEDAVSFTKGCYIGQEIIARIHWRGHIAKKLAGLIIIDEPAAPHALAGAKVKASDEEREIGRLTSCVFSPRLNRSIALGIIKYDYLAAGTEVKIIAGENELSSAQIAALPLVRGSWVEPESDAESN